MCGRLVNLDTVARVIAEYYHLKTDTQLAALNDALSRVPAETVGKELFGNTEQLDDTISRRETVKSIRDAMLAWSYMPLWREDKIVDAVKALPSAQQERKKGKWIYNSPVTMKCNQCGFVIKDWDWHRFKYCPNCIADMRGENDG